MKRWLLVCIGMLSLFSQSQASTLSDAANAMTPGTWVTLNTNGYTQSILAPGGPSASIFQYADSATWDATLNKFYFMGVSHGNAAWTMITYDEATNTWTTIPPHSDFIPSLIGHAYEHNALDTTNHVYYFRLYNSKTVYKYVISSNTWSKLTDIPMSSKQAAGGLEYFPARDALIFVDGDWGVWQYNITAGTWQRIANTNGENVGGFPKLMMGAYHNFIEYNPVHNRMWFGGGQASTSSYRMDAAGNITSAAAAPFPLGILNTIISCDPNTGKYLVYAANQTFWEYDIIANTWTIQPSSRNPPWFTDTQDGPVLSTIEANIPEYGVTMYCTYRSGDLSKVRLYKHAATPGDSTPPSVPTGLTVITSSSVNINLNWSASTDNFAVAGYRVERCQGAGCSNFAEIAQPVTPSYSDATAAAATFIYRYRVRAVDTANNLSGSSTAVESTLFIGSTPGNFTLRCAAAGVVRCFGFDIAGDFNQGVIGGSGAWGENFGIFAPSGASGDYTRATQDINVKASGASSLRFRIPTNSPADTSGSWFTNFSSDLNTRIGEGETVYVQWRQRYDNSFITTNYAGSDGYKQIIFSEGDRAGVCDPMLPTTATCPSSCTEIEIVFGGKEVVIDALTSRNIQIGYHSCNFFDGFEYWDPEQHQVVTQNGVNCLHPAFNVPPCIAYWPNEWMTYKLRVTVGTWNQPNSTVQFWVGRQGQPSILTIDFRPSNGHGVVLHNSSPSTAEYGKLWLTPYATNKDSSQVHPETYTWYDELIISTQDIADPLDTGAPAPPENLRKVP